MSKVIRVVVEESMVSTREGEGKRCRRKEDRNECGKKGTRLVTREKQAEMVWQRS